MFVRDSYIMFRYGRFTFIESRTIEIEERHQVRCMDIERICALDPGILNDSLGASEVFKCNNCGLKADRDLHAARNILLRHLV